LVAAKQAWPGLMHELKQLSTSDNLIALRAKRKGQAMVIQTWP
jgi:hypothetical protein